MKTESFVGRVTSINKQDGAHVVQLFGVVDQKHQIVLALGSHDPRITIVDSWQCVGIAPRVGSLLRLRRIVGQKQFCHARVFCVEGELS